MTAASGVVPGRRSTAPKVAALVAVGMMLLIAQQLGVLQRFAEPSLMANTLVELGPWGYVAFVAAYAALQPFGVPGTIFVMAAPLIWPWPVAFALSMTGTMAASVVGFSFARFVAREWLESRLPERFRSYQSALEHRGFSTVFLLRLVFWMPPMLHAFFGVSKVGFRTHFWGSIAGYVPPLLLVSYFGEQVWTALMKAPPATWFALAAATAAAVIIWYALRRRPFCDNSRRGA
jgi:uncharacterized membrane protein YdjX (TVP38/TMEM64 family)